MPFPAWILFKMVAIACAEVAAEFATTCSAGATIEQDFGNANAGGLTNQCKQMDACGHFRTCQDRCGLKKYEKIFSAELMLTAVGHPTVDFKAADQREFPGAFPVC